MIVLFLLHNNYTVQKYKVVLLLTSAVLLIYFLDYKIKNELNTSNDTGVTSLYDYTTITKILRTIRVFVNSILQVRY